MEQELKDKLQRFFTNNKNLCMALNNWIKIKNKPLKLIDALECIYKGAEGNSNVMKFAIEQLTAKNKLQGRANAAYGEENLGDKTDIIKDENGEWQFVGFNANFQKSPQGQHRPSQDKEKSKIFKQDGQISKTYQNAEKKLMDLGKEVREVFPEYDNHMLTQAMQSIRNYAIARKINPNRVVKYIKMGKLFFDENTFEIKLASNESFNRKVIVITEAMANEINSLKEITEYKFNNEIKKYLHDLLVDPVNAQVPTVFSVNGYNRYKFNKILMNNNLLYKEEKICDKDENGQPKTATMKVKYKVPKKNFDRKLRNLYIKLFERNIPDAYQRTPNDNDQNLRDNIDIALQNPLTMGFIGHPKYKMPDDAAKVYNEELQEDGAAAMSGGATNATSSGQYSQPVFPVNRRSMYGDVDEDTTTFSVGNYQYTAPPFSDKEANKRKNGKGGSVSVNKA